MRQWGEKSKSVYCTLDVRLQQIVDELLQEYMDLTLLEGYRDQAKQDRMYELGRSKLKYPDSAHNKEPSKAVDLQPYPRPKDPRKLRQALSYIGGVAVAIGRRKGVPIRWGGCWNMNGDVAHNRFDDLFHLEIYEK